MHETVDKPRWQMLDISTFTIYVMARSYRKEPGDYQ